MESSSMFLFRDRAEAGARLAESYARGVNEGRLRRPALVLALPRGGLPVAAPVACSLRVPLEPWISRKLGAPANPEFAIGAIAEGGGEFIDRSAIDALGISERTLEMLLARERAELRRRATRYRRPALMSEPGWPAILRDLDVLLVDDGLATGSTALAAADSLRKLGVASITFACPVGSAEGASRLSAAVDQVFCLEYPPYFVSVGSWYEEFSQTEDPEIDSLLQEVPGFDGSAQLEVSIPMNDAPGRLGGIWKLPTRARALVLFAHGSGSSRKSPRNLEVARALQDAGLGTLLFDLLTPSESRAGVFDIPLLAGRLVQATRWARSRLELLGYGGLPIAYFGASTGAAAALVAAANPGAQPISSIVSRGGRPDLVEPTTTLTSPTLLIVGSEDREVLSLNREALARLQTHNHEAHLRLVPGATHLFEEPGALKQVARLASDWFSRHARKIPGQGRSVA